MFPASFHESNGYLGKPPDMTHDECDALSVWRGDVTVDGGGAVPAVVSCWKLTPDELEEVNRTGRVWLYVVGRTMPPVMMAGNKPEFP